MKSLTLLFPALWMVTLVAAALAPADADEVPPLDGARVTIPYEELKRLFEAARAAGEGEAAQAPPIASVLKTARYHLDLSGSTPSLTAEYEAFTFADSWQAIPLCGGGGIRLTDSEAGGDASVVRSGTDLALLTRTAGEQSARLTVAVDPAAKWGREDGFRFVPAPATVNELTVTGIPEGRSVAIAGLSPSPAESGDWRFHLPGDGGEIRLLLRDATAEAERPVIPSAWTLHSQIVVRYADGRLRYSARVQAQAESGSGLSLTAVLPPKASRIGVEGEDLDHFQSLPRREDGRRVRIDWKTRDTLDRTFGLTWEIPQSPLAETWTLTLPRAEPPDEAAAVVEENPAGSRALIALVPVEGLELTHPDFQSAVESRQLPAWLREQLGGDESLTAELSGADPFELAASWLPRVDTAQATVSLARFETRLVADGAILVTADYHIQHSAPIDWQLDLPSADQILSCEVNQLAAQPIQRGEDVIEFQLPAPPIEKPKKEKEEAKDDTQPAGTKVHLCYSLKLDPLDPVSGRVAVELPQTDLFIHRLEWSLAIPERYEPTAIEGNVELAAGDSDWSSKFKTGDNLIRLTKDLCRDEKPPVEIFYQRKELTAAATGS